MAYISKFQAPKHQQQAAQRMRVGMNAAVVAAKQRSESNGLGLGSQEKVNHTGNSRDGEAYTTKTNGKGQVVHSYAGGGDVVLKSMAPGNRRYDLGSGQSQQHANTDNTQQKMMMQSLASKMKTVTPVRKAMPLSGRIG